LLLRQDAAFDDILATGHIVCINWRYARLRQDVIPASRPARGVAGMGGNMTYLSKTMRGAAVAALLATLTAAPAVATEFKVAVGDGAGGTQEALGKTFAAALAEKSGGKHSARLFLNGQLGDEQDTVGAAATGTLDFSILAINNITPFSPEVGSLTLPYVILSLEDAEKVTQGPIGQRLVDKTIENAGVRIIGWA